MTAPTSIIPYGFCHCGCGQRCLISPITSKAKGWLAGYPRRYIAGHHAKHLAALSRATPEHLILDGLQSVRLPLSKGMFTLIDEDEYEHLSSYFWCAQGPMGDGRFYATRKEGSQLIYMHREILGLLPGDPRQGDHRKPNSTLDNRKSNLRIATQLQNTWNSRTRRNSSTGLKGAYPYYRGGFYSHITVNKKVIYLGHFQTAEDAHATYCDAAVKYHGEFARAK
jgi:hypothetical protein